MDGISGAASVIAVISLAVQLGSGAHDLYTFLGTISDAPSELRRLKTHLSHIRAITFLAQDALENQRRLHGDSVPVANVVLMSLEGCEDQVQHIWDVVKNADGVGRGSRITSRTWARFKFALRKDKIADFERQLGGSLQLLNLALTTSLMISSTQTSIFLVERDNAGSTQQDLLPYRSIPKTPSNEHSTMTANKPLAVDHAQSQTDVSNMVSFQRTNTYWGCDWRLFGYIRTRTTRMESTRQTMDGHLLKEDRCQTEYTVHPAFLPWSLQFCIKKFGLGSPQTTIKIQRHLSSETKCQFQEIMGADDLCGLQRLYSTGELSPDYKFFPSVLDLAFKRSAGGNGLYVTSTGRFFLQQKSSFTALEIDRVSRLIFESGPCHKSTEIFRDIYSRYQDYDEPLDILFGWCFPEEPTLEIFETIEWVALTGLRHTSLSKNTYLGSALHNVISFVFQDVCPDACGLAVKGYQFASRLVRIGADLHYTGANHLSILEWIVSNTTPENETLIISKWLGLLAECGINLQEYLTKEEIISNVISPPPTNSYRSLDFKMWPTRIIEYTSNANGLRHFPTVRPYVDADGPCSLVLEEFTFMSGLTIKNGTHCSQFEDLIAFGQSSELSEHQSNQPLSKVLPDLKNLWLHTKSCDDSFIPGDEVEVISEPIDFGSLSLCDCDINGNYLDLWPLSGRAHTMCDISNSERFRCVYGICCGAHMCTFNHDRFQRKQDKKEAKRLKQEGKQVCEYAVPGAWVD